MVDARALHRALGVGRDFSNWIKDRLNFCEAVEGVGYEVGLFAKTGENSLQGRPPIDYRLAVPLAKELALMENTDAGKRVRRYFLEVEAGCNPEMESRGKLRPLNEGWGMLYALTAQNSLLGALMQIVPVVKLFLMRLTVTNVAQSALTDDQSRFY
jgi:phage anti-repressor protein